MATSYICSRATAVGFVPYRQKWQKQKAFAGQLQLQLDEKTKEEAKAEADDATFISSLPAYVTGNSFVMVDIV